MAAVYARDVSILLIVCSMQLFTNIRNFFFEKLKKPSDYLLPAISAFSSLVTFWLISYSGIKIVKQKSVIILIIIFNLILIFLVGNFILKKFVNLMREQKQGKMGSRLHITIMKFFTVMTAVPSLLLVILAWAYFNSILSVWFNQSVKNSLNDTNSIAESYLKENKESFFKGDLQLIMGKLSIVLNIYDFGSEKDRFNIKKELDEILLEQKLEDILIIFDGPEGRIFIKSSFSTSNEINITGDDLKELKAKTYVIRERDDFMNFFAVIHSDRPNLKMYLYIEKKIDAKIWGYKVKAKNLNMHFSFLLKNQESFQLILVLLFVLSSCLLLISSISAALNLSNTLFTPIKEVITAAEMVSIHGDLSIRVKTAKVNNEIDNLVSSFNEMTKKLEEQNIELVISEKKSAWADIARKIAHEVKNPLTPIQLSAERIKKRYISEIKSDKEIFIKCIDTIIRQVSQIENLINEFSAFARMPDAKFEEINIVKLIRDVIFIHKNANKNIQYSFYPESEAIEWTCDSNQITQVFNNLLQNSANAINESNINRSGSITTYVKCADETLNLIVEDNGPGFPEEKRERLLEPYYTTRKKGTGLGLAIILRIVSDHFGTMKLVDSFEMGGGRGARVEISLSKKC